MVTKTERKRIREVQRLAEQAEPLQEFGEAGPGRGHVPPHKRPPLPRGMTKAYLVARIARDHPAILERMKAGEFVTVRQAAIAAGIMKNPTRLEHFQKLWRNANNEERETIAVEVQWWLMWQAPEWRDAMNRKVAKLLAEREARPDGTPVSGRREYQPK
jgi:hypothetical protein